MEIRYYKLNKDHTVTALAGIEDLINGKSITNKVERTVTKGHVEVSTIFLVFDHNWDGHGKPILFETMIFGGEHDSYQRRYYTYDEALEAHNKIVQALNEDHHPDYYINKKED